MWQTEDVIKVIEENASSTALVFLSGKVSSLIKSKTIIANVVVAFRYSLCHWPLV